MALTMIVMIPIGAIASKRSSPNPSDIERNCFVTSSPKRASKGVRSVNKPLARLFVSTDGVGVTVLEVVVATIALSTT